MNSAMFHDPSVPCSTPKEVEHRNTSGLQRNRTRNTSGTLDLKALAAATLLRLHSGTPSGTPAEQPPPEVFHPPGTPEFCPHVKEQWLREWYAEHPEVTCARCWLERKGRLALEGPAKTPLKSRGTVATGAARNHIVARYTGGAG